MAFNYDIEEVPPSDLPCVEHDIRRAKKFLQKHSPESGDSLYDHLTEVLNKILSERPKNAVDIFEQYSRQLKEERFRNNNDHIRDIYVPPTQYEDAKKLIELFQHAQGSEDFPEENLENDDNSNKKKPNLLDLMYYFEQTGVGIPRSEMVILNLSIRKLMAGKPIENVRFWGKILGKPNNYYVVEADLEEREVNRRLEEGETFADETMQEMEVPESENEEYMNAERNDGENAAREEPSGNVVEENNLVLNFPPLPQTNWKPPVEISPERIGTGVNKKTYFVCRLPGLDDWVELPMVTPQQIISARLLVRCFTGNLETPIHTFPPFPGTEKNYLRAQIARITAATSISPIGWYNFGEDEEEEALDEEEEGIGEIIRENPHYDPLPTKDLVDQSMTHWCHHELHILKQGRTTWWNPKAEGDEDELAEEEEDIQEEEEERGGISRINEEVGPPLLTALSEDASLDSIPAWTARQSSLIQPDTAVAFIRSNIWPGAFAFATERKFANVYIGSGQKFTAFNYTPPNMPVVQDEYKIGPEVMEVQDPSVDQEELWRTSHSPVPQLPQMGEEEEELEDESPSDEEEDDDED